MSITAHLDDSSVAAAAPTVAADRVPFKIKLFYGIGDLGSGLMGGASAYVVFFYNQVMGLSAVWVGVAMFAGLYVDAVVDAVVGSLSDTTRTRWGRRHPYIFIAAIPIALSFFLTFSVPPGLPHWALMGWMIVTTLLWRISGSFHVVPYWALGAELSRDFHERTIVGANRIFFMYAGFSGSFVLNMVVFGAGSANHRGQFDAGNYHTIAIIVAMAVIVSGWTCAIGTRSAIPGLPKAVSTFSFWTMLREMRGFLGNRPFRVFFAGAFMYCVVHGIYTTISIYLGTYFWVLSTQQIFLLPALGIVGVVVGTFIWPAISRRIGKKSSYILGTAGYFIFASAPVLLKTSGLFIAHDSAAYFPVIALFGFLAYLTGASGSVIAASMLPDVIDDYAAGKAERNVAGLLTGMLNLNTKVGAAVTNLIVGTMLSFVGLEHKVEGAVAPAVADRLGLTYVLALGIFTIVCMGIFSFYSIPDRKWRPVAVGSTMNK
jgi:Na+/melibiose symporter-like transporter